MPSVTGLPAMRSASPCAFFPTSVLPQPAVADCHFIDVSFVALPWASSSTGSAQSAQSQLNPSPAPVTARWIWVAPRMFASNLTGPLFTVMRGEEATVPEAIVPPLASICFSHAACVVLNSSCRWRICFSCVAICSSSTTICRLCSGLPMGRFGAICGSPPPPLTGVLL